MKTDSIAFRLIAGAALWLGLALAVSGFVLAALLILTAAMLWQHGRYQDFRQTHAKDRQPAFYGGDAFHVLWLFELAPRQSLEPAPRKIG